MFVFKRNQGPIRKTSSEDVLRRLNSFLNRSSPELVEVLYRLFQDQQNAVTYKELREAAINGYEDEILQWQNDYAKFVNEKMYPIWKQAMQAGASMTEGRIADFVFDNSDRMVTQWLNQHGADFITNVGTETRNAVKAILYKGQIEGWSSAEMARYIRPCVGLTRPDAEANAKYQKKIYDTLLKNNPRIKPEDAAKRAHEAALKYAGKQHRRRADMIANTELAYAYNRGTHESVRQAMRDGLMGTCVKVWATAGTERVCPHCMALNGQAVGFEDNFDIKGRVLFEGMHETPPAHPRCRCAIKYKEISKPADAGTVLRETMSGQLQSLTDAEKEIITRYTGALATQVNTALWTGRMNERLEKSIHLLDSALSKGVVPREVTVLRKTIPQYLPWPIPKKVVTDEDMMSLVDSTLTYKSYTSTSLTNFDYPLRNVYMYLKVPAGHKGALYIKELAHTKYKYQEEILFKRGMRCIITSVIKEGNSYVLTGEVI